MHKQNLTEQGSVKCFLDTESIGYYGPVMLIQYAIDNAPIQVHHVYQQTAESTVELIHELCNYTIVGFNLAHDWFKITQLLNCLKDKTGKVKPSYFDRPEAPYLCPRPAGAIDLMVVGRRTARLQATMERHPILLRQVPIEARDIILHHMDSLDLDPMSFAKKGGVHEWQVKPLKLNSRQEAKDNESIDPSFENLKLSFCPSASLKVLAKYLLGDTEKLLYENLGLERVKETGIDPYGDAWKSNWYEQIFAYKNNDDIVKYAIRDVDITRRLWQYFGEPTDDDESILACSVGTNYAIGYEIDQSAMLQRCRLLYKRLKHFRQQVHYNSPTACLTYLRAGCSPILHSKVTDTRDESLQKLGLGTTELAKRARRVRNARKAHKEFELLNKLQAVGRMYVQFKVTGTKSNRMSGGGMVKKGGSVNPQGIKKGKVRKLFPLAPEGYTLCGGDYDGQEVSIAAVVYNDERLSRDVATGRKIHAEFGASLYRKTYDEIMATAKLNKTDPNALYDRAKTGFFAKMYGAMAQKLQDTLKLPVKDIEDAIIDFERKYPGIRETRDQIERDMTAILQLPSGEMERRTPREYIEAVTGFRRYFTEEYRVINGLLDIAETFPDIGGRVVRNGRVRTTQGAVRSALYGAAFNIQNSIFRAAGNHIIQSVGGYLTKYPQITIYKTFQPVGVHQLVVMALNVHDELQVPILKGREIELQHCMNACIAELKSVVPLVSMEFKINLKDWSEK